MAVKDYRLYIHRKVIYYLGTGREEFKIRRQNYIPLSESSESFYDRKPQYLPAWIYGLGIKSD